jgi:hypothetical protein
MARFEKWAESQLLGFPVSLYRLQDPGGDCGKSTEKKRQTSASLREEKIRKTCG